MNGPRKADRMSDTDMLVEAMSETFRQKLDEARKARIPVMALRPDYVYPDEMDDIVVEDVKTFRAEAMSDDMWWMCCYFHNGESVTFHVVREKRPARLSVSVTEEPPEWRDWDEMYRASVGLPQGKS